MHASYLSLSSTLADQESSGNWAFAIPPNASLRNSSAKWSIYENKVTLSLLVIRLSYAMIFDATGYLKKIFCCKKFNKKICKKIWRSNDRSSVFRFYFYNKHCSAVCVKKNHEVDVKMSRAKGLCDTHLKIDNYLTIDIHFARQSRLKKATRSRY